MTKTHTPRSVLSILALLALTGCGPSFQEDFNINAAIPVPQGSITGAWIGAWHDVDGQHFGELQALVSQISDTEYQVRYRAIYRWLFLDTPFEITVTLRGEQVGGTFHFEGSEDLGFPYGMYDYSGYATDSLFFSTYEAGDSKGDYQLRRVSDNYSPSE